MKVVEQIQMSYDPVEDRLVIGFGEASTKIWLTRRLLQLAWPQLESLISERIDADAWRALQIPELISGGNSLVQHKTTKPPEFETTENAPSSFIATQFTVDFGYRECVTMHWMNDQKQGVSLRLSNELLSVFFKILMQALALAKWSLEMEGFKKALDAFTDSSQLEQLH